MTQTKLDYARLVLYCDILRYSYDARIVRLLLSLKILGKADLTVKLVID